MHDLSVEKNFIRSNIIKGTFLFEFTQQDITIVVNHTDAYGRMKLEDKVPFRVFASLYGLDVLRRPLGYAHVAVQAIREMSAIQ